MFERISNITVSRPTVQDFPSLVSQFQATLEAGNTNENIQRIGVLILRHSDRPVIHNNDTLINEEGINRIYLYREILSSHGIFIDSDFVFSSPVIRCVQTAARIACVGESKVQKVRWVTGSPWNLPNKDEDLSSRKIWEEMKDEFGSDRAREIWLKGGDESKGLSEAHTCGQINYESILENVLQPLAFRQSQKKSKLVNLDFTNNEGTVINPIAICCTHDICVMGLASIFQSETTFVPFLGGIFLCYDFDSEHVIR